MEVAARSYRGVSPLCLRGCDKQLTGTQAWIYPELSIGAGAITSLRKVRNFRGEQNSLERLAKDSESLVCQVSETL
jgi:hypothetical protein